MSDGGRKNCLRQRIHLSDLWELQKGLLERFITFSRKRTDVTLVCACIHEFFFFLLLLFWSNYISIHFVLAYYFRYILNTFATCKSHHSHFWYRYIMIITNVPKHRQRRQWYHQWYWISNLKIEIRRVFDVKWIFSAHTCERCSDIDEEFWCRYMKSYNRRRFQIN